ncbi:hypothetical protein [Microbacterium plantarum]|uniref:Uncharacterized protein n=1 Tax=Microbacterium plantarum TaxID=1816425 RepID=A0ABV5ESV6_9MICO
MSTFKTDLAEALPASWSASVKETYVQVDEDNPDLTAAQRSALYEACLLLATAEALDAATAAHGLMTTGSAGQLVVNPAVAEARAHRLGAQALLKPLAPIGAADPAGGSSSAAAAALAGKRWSRR